MITKRGYLTLIVIVGASGFCFNVLRGVNVPAHYRSPRFTKKQLFLGFLMEKTKKLRPPNAFFM